ncbi:uncharacterized protein TRIVIDRAFT_36430 [Trichoderma virens Gv29-8]|uniref:Prion-inhibition and propagation HeLo domain-containing protein n=1 Tax=Hypocrea virens (strain Gv29-8 / FGSC 10586) TaxID=413071 RepID=G9MG31_HYPVG|nr:uncharacterized protein TRIVIDRAFT_36430 [Trichoderma virens Gv29-8]EHK26481.1 hypothetical protein TRIVIDRAFT_36430 [Trichoderma virens Gv29-8]
MDAVGGTAGIFYFIHRCLSHFKQARGFEDEFGIYQLQLQGHLSHCASISKVIHNTNSHNKLIANATDGPENIPKDQEATTAETLSAIQDALRRAQLEAAMIEAQCTATGLDPDAVMRTRMAIFLHRQKAHLAKTTEGLKWALYKRESRDKFIAKISVLLLQLERQVSMENLTMGDARLMYMANPWWLFEHSSTNGSQ